MISPVCAVRVHLALHLHCVGEISEELCSHIFGCTLFYAFSCSLLKQKGACLVFWSLLLLLLVAFSPES